MYNIGVLYGIGGYGIIKNDTLSTIWYKKASSSNCNYDHSSKNVLTLNHAQLVFNKGNVEEAAILGVPIAQG